MSGDFDPRDNDTRERDDDGIQDREEQWLVIGRAANSQQGGDESFEPDVRARDDGCREDRDRESEGRENDRGADDPRDVFVRDLGLPRTPERELVHDRDRHYTLNGSETRSLATVGAFRVVSERDLNGARGDVRHLEKQGLIERVPVNDRERAVTLTDRGRGLLERHQNVDSDQRQAFYAGADKARERTHDVQIYRAYLREAAQLQDRGARILRVELDRELKREYQRFLQERNRGDRDSDGRPDRSREEVEDWAREHDLPYFDEQVHFPDARIEYRDVDGSVDHLDVEVTTEHYRGGHDAAASRSGFSIHSSGGGGGGAPFDPRVAEDFL
jgi:DNA-binding MarR family transcriptional regulator